MPIRRIGLTERIRTKTPSILLDLPVWLLWRYEYDEKGDKKKVPYYADGECRSGELDTPEDRARLVTFDAAEEAFDARPGYYAGYGVALGRIGDQVLSGIDLDDCREETKLTANASEVVNAAGSYAEISPGNCGVKIFGWGDIGTEGSTGSGLEIYSGKRFFTVTGRSIAAPELADLTQAADLARSLYLAGVPEGARNNTLFTYACGLRDSGVSFPDALSRVRGYNLRFNQPPLTEAELMSTTKSAFSRPPREGMHIRHSYLVGPKGSPCHARGAYWTTIRAADGRSGATTAGRRRVRCSWWHRQIDTHPVHSCPHYPWSLGIWTQDSTARSRAVPDRGG